MSKADGSGAVFFTTAANAGTLYGRLLDTNGEPYGSAYPLATGVYDYGYADATVLTNGNIVVTWMGDASSTILARVYTPDLQPVIGIITVFDRTFSMEAPDIAATPDGGFVIAAGYRISSTDTDVYIKTFNGSGTPLHENWYTPGSTLDAYPSVAALTDGTIVLYWMRTINGGDPQVWRAIYSSALGVIAAPTLYLDNAASPEVSARPDGSYLLSYSYDYYDMHSRLMGPGGALDTSFIAYRHSIDSATSSAGHTIVVMQSGYGPGASLYGQLTLPNGVIIDSASILVDGSTDWGGQSPLVEWVNPYTVELAYERGQYQAKDGAAVARYLVIATTNGDASPNHLLGDALIDVMTGGAGNDTLDGSGGPDTMGGGSGNDLYYVDNWADLVDESSPGSDGWDTVYSWINYALPNNVEALALLGGATHGTGNAANNHLSGNAGNNVLDGSFGADTMAGGHGNDSYYVDN
ncbi:MAG TPA: hypothetical protein VEC60_13795, partial [Reyranella sp.]|nr:hypothetical protein [Reyranella sp.]